MISQKRQQNAGGFEIIVADIGSIEWVKTFRNRKEIFAL
jgi:hypothetical protein